MQKIKKIGVFASGSGTNTEHIVHYFRSHNYIRVGLILCNKPHAGVIERAKKLDIPYCVFDREMFKDAGHMLGVLRDHDIDWIVLAGFLWLVPAYLVQAYPDKIVNIHPALLPKYGGKGMYGERVHQAVLENGEKETGITIHYVNNEYDRGEIIFQRSCDVLSGDTTEELAKRVHELEYKYYPEVIEQVILQGTD